MALGRIKALIEEVLPATMLCKSSFRPTNTLVTSELFSLARNARLFSEVECGQQTLNRTVH